MFLYLRSNLSEEDLDWEDISDEEANEIESESQYESDVAQGFDQESEIDEALENLEYTSDSSDDEESNESNLSQNTDETRVLDSVLRVLYKIRAISKLTRKSNNVQNHVLKLISEDQSVKNKVSFIIDFFVRWNSTFKMIKRFKTLKQVVISITSFPEKISGIKDAQLTKLKCWLLSSDDWALVEVLSKILEPFHLATELASGQTYPTLSISLVILVNLKKHLDSIGTSDEDVLKRILLERLKYHLESKITKKQKEYTQVVFKNLSLFSSSYYYLRSFS